jgi:hypothetical protein
MSAKPFTKITVTPNYAIGHLIQWKVDPTFMEAEPYNFVVEVSGTPNFSDIAYELPAGDSFFVVEDNNFKQAIYVDLYYRVKLTTADRNTYYSQIIAFGSFIETRRNYKLASEIVRKELLRHRKYCGSTSYLLKRKAFGEVRKDAVDPISGVPITDNTSDFGTGLDGGYYKAVKVLASYESNKQTRLLNDGGLGTTETFEVLFRMVGYPNVESQDVIIDADSSNRFLVKQVDSVYFPGTSIVVVQKLQASMIPTTDPIYQIEVK